MRQLCAAVFIFLLSVGHSIGVPDVRAGVIELERHSQLQLAVEIPFVGTYGLELNEEEYRSLQRMLAAPSEHLSPIRNNDFVYKEEFARKIAPHISTDGNKLHFFRGPPRDPLTGAELRFPLETNVTLSGAALGSKGAFAVDASNDALRLISERGVKLVKDGKNKKSKATQTEN